MKLTSKGRYAVTAMLDLALHTEDGPVTLAAISERQGISLSYLEQLFTRLRKHGLVASTRGPGGGYSLSRSASEIPVSAVVTAVLLLLVWITNWLDYCLPVVTRQLLSTEFRMCSTL